MKSAEGVNLSPLYGSLRRVRLSPTYASLPVRLSPLYCFLRCTGLSVWCERSAWCKASVVRGEHGVRRAAAWCEDGRDERVLSVVQGERCAKEEGPKRAASDLYESGAASTAPSGSSSDRVSAPVWPWWAWWAWCARGLVRKKRVVQSECTVVQGERGARRAAWCNDGRDERVLSVVQGERGAKEEGARWETREKGAASVVQGEQRGATTEETSAC